MTIDDFEYICAAEYIPWERLRGKRLLITGATGLIGFSLTSALLYANRKRNLHLSILALVRDETRAVDRFAKWLIDDAPLKFLVGNVETPPKIEGEVDFILHGASTTASCDFVCRPVETIRTSVLGTLHMLSLAAQKSCEGFVYLSSMEVYGHPSKGHKVKESDECNLLPQEVRSSYPISKLLCENLCCSYVAQYNVPVVIARLAQTFGADVHPNDVRIFAQIGRCIRNREDIVLHTQGKTERSYLYVADAVTALLTILLKGQPGQAYNIADEHVYCSIAEMVQRIAKAGGIGVRFELTDEHNRGYGRPIFMDLDTSRIQALGWRVEAVGTTREDRLDMYAQKMGQYLLKGNAKERL